MRLLPVLSTLANEMWEDADQMQLEADFPQFYDEPPALPQQNTMTSKTENVLLTWLLLFLLRLQAKHYIPDSAVNCLLKFLYMFFSIVGRHSDFVANLALCFPVSVYQMQKFFGIKEEFTRFVVCLKQLLIKILSITSEEISVNAAYRKYKSITVNGVRFNCSTCKKHSIAVAYWDDTLFGCCPTPLASSTLINPQDATHRPVKIKYFVKISYTVSNSVHAMCFVAVAWFKPHPSRFEISKPAQVWCEQLFESAGLQSFLPIQQLCCRCVYSTMKLHDENVLVVVPLVE